jgi:hypothetical protein
VGETARDRQFMLSTTYLVFLSKPRRIVIEKQ